MSLQFQKSSKPTIGVEIELQILDSLSLDLTPKAQLLIRNSRSRGLERVKNEIHQSMVEIDSEISEDVKQCRSYLQERFQRLHQIADDLGILLGISGTHPFQRWVDRLITPCSRYRQLHKKYQWLIRRVNVYGLHVHIGIESGEKALAISNILVRFLPHLLALSANSPFWQGVDTGMQSSRINILESFPYAGKPLPFHSWKEFEYYFETLKRAGAVGSLKDLYWHIRPNIDFGTLEFRICDAMTSLDETMAIVALIQSLVVFVSQNLDSHDWSWTDEQQWLSQENQWIAARDGLQGILLDVKGKTQKISESILHLIEKLSSTANELSCWEELQLLKQIIFQGNGAERQKKIFKETGSLKEVAFDSVCQLRKSVMNCLQEQQSLCLSG